MVTCFCIEWLDNYLKKCNKVEDFANFYKSFDNMSSYSATMLIHKLP